MGRYTLDAIDHQLEVFTAIRRAEVANASRPGEGGTLSWKQKYRAAENAKDATLKAQILAACPAAAEEDWKGVPHPYQAVNDGAFALFKAMHRFATDQQPDRTTYRAGAVTGEESWLAWPAEDLLATLLGGITVRTVRNRLRTLEKAEWITWTGETKNGARVYRLAELFSQEALNALQQGLYGRFVAAEVERLEYLHGRSAQKVAMAGDSVLARGFKERANALASRLAGAREHLATLEGDGFDEVVEALRHDGFAPTFDPDEPADEDDVDLFQDAA